MFAPQRLVIVGLPGSGKTTLAQQLAQRCQLTCIELDAFYWEAHWTPAPLPLFRQRVRHALAQAERWVIDGNYSRVRDLTWDQADTIVWLDYALPLILWRLWWRSWRRSLMRIELWNGNHETIHGQFFAHDSLFRYAVANYRHKRHEYIQLFREPSYAGHKRVHLTTPAATKTWLDSVSDAA